jgi:phospholipid N-methyltransferase
MRDQWYGDNRDLVKWGVLLELVRRHRARHVLQILYYRSNTWEQMEIDGEQVELPAAVTQHFRSTKSVSAIHCAAPVEVVSEPFENRSHYLQIVLSEFSQERIVQELSSSTQTQASNPQASRGFSMYSITRQEKYGRRFPPATLWFSISTRPIATVLPGSSRRKSSSSGR